MKKAVAFFACAMMGAWLLAGCSDSLHALAGQKDAAIRGLADAKDKVLAAAADVVGDAPKQAILGALNSLNEVGGKAALTSETFLQGKRTLGADEYVGSYTANYANYAGTEVLFGGTAVERAEGATVTIQCTLEVTDGQAILFKKSGSADPVALLAASGSYRGEMEVGSVSDYIGVWGDGFTGKIALALE